MSLFLYFFFIISRSSRIFMLHNFTSQWYISLLGQYLRKSSETNSFCLAAAPAPMVTAYHGAGQAAATTQAAWLQSNMLHNTGSHRAGRHQSGGGYDDVNVKLDGATFTLKSRKAGQVFFVPMPQILDILLLNSWRAYSANAPGNNLGDVQRDSVPLKKLFS